MLLALAMTRKKSHLSDEDRALWKAATAVIEPHTKTSAHQKKRKFKNEEPAAAASKKTTKKTDEKIIEKSSATSSRKTWQSLPHHPAPATTPKKQVAQELPSIADDVTRHIKTKKRSIDVRLDLHGMTQEVAHRKVIAFINTCYAHGLKTVLIITGKGNASSSEGVLQKNLPRWLSADASTSKHIAGISPAPRELGGSGAFVITLKRQR